MSRPSVDVVVPIAGSPAQLEAVARRLAALDVGPDDSLTLADNRPAAEATPVSVAAPVRLLAAHERQSSYFARNRGAAAGRAEWLLFLDADVEFEADLIDRLFADAPGEATAILAGGIEDVVVVDGTVARWLRHRAAMSQRNTLVHDPPYAQTAHCAVRRSAFEAIGGFEETIRSGGDADLCFRIGAAGWGLEERDAAVRHEARPRLRRLLGQIARHGSGAAWLHERHPGSFPPRTLWPDDARWLARETLRAARHWARGDRDAAATAVLPPLTTVTFELGRRLPNDAPAVSSRGWRPLDRWLR